MASLTFDLANTVAITDSVEAAWEVYEASQRRGFANAELLKRRITAMEKIRAKNALSGQPVQVILLTLTLTLVLVVGLVGLGFWLSSRSS